MENTQTIKALNLQQRNWRFLLGLAAGALISVAGMGIAAATNVIDTADVGEIESIVPGAISITDEQARSTVLDAYPGTSVIEVDLDTQPDGSLVYDVSLDSGEEIMVDARTGEVLGAEVDDADPTGGEDA